MFYSWTLIDALLISTNMASMEGAHAALPGSINMPYGGKGHSGVTESPVIAVLLP